MNKKIILKLLKKESKQARDYFEEFDETQSQGFALGIDRAIEIIETN